MADLTSGNQTSDHPRLTPFQRWLALCAFPDGSQIAHIERFGQRDGPPLYVTVASPDGTTRSVVLRTSNRRQGVMNVPAEARLLPVLARLGLPVPELIAGPAYDPKDANDWCGWSVLGWLPGRTLQSLALAPEVGPEKGLSLLLTAFDRLQSLTEPLMAEPSLRSLPRRDLLAELQGIIDVGGPWDQHPLFKNAVRCLVPRLVAMGTPLAFSSGDMQPENFLSDGDTVTGFIDFEWACFEDPLYGLAKYRVYDIYPFHRAGLIDQYLQAHGIPASEFAPRLAVRCLWTLQRELPPFATDAAYCDYLARRDGGLASTHVPEGGTDRYREYVLGLLDGALQEIT